MVPATQAAGESHKEANEGTTVYQPMLVDDEKDDEIAMIRKRIFLVQQSWRRVEEEMQSQAIRDVYDSLFQRHPALRDLFVNVNISTQAQKVFEVMQVSIRFLHNMDVFVPELQDLGQRHALHYGVYREHYYALNDVFLSFLRSNVVQSSSSHTTNESVIEAWRFVLKYIADVMADAGDEALVAMRQNNAPREQLDDDCEFPSQGVVTPETDSMTEDFGNCTI